MKKITFFSIIFILCIQIALASNQAIAIRVETSGSDSKLVKTIIQDICLDNGFTVVDRENTGPIYYEQDLKNNPRYNSGTAVNTGNMIIASILIKINTKVEAGSYFDISGYLGGGHGDVNNRSYQATMEYSVSSIELGTYSEVKTVTGSANDTDIYGSYKWLRGRYGESSSMVRTAAIYDAAINIVPDIEAIASNIMNNYYVQTEGKYQPYPDPVKPVTVYKISANYGNKDTVTNVGNSGLNNNTGFNSTGVLPYAPTNSNPDEIKISQLHNSSLSPKNYILLEPDTNYLLQIYTSKSTCKEILRIKNNTIFYSNDTSVNIDPSLPTKLKLDSLGFKGKKVKFALSDSYKKYVFEVQY